MLNDLKIKFSAIVALLASWSLSCDLPYSNFLCKRCRTVHAVDITTKSDSNESVNSNKQVNADTTGFFYRTYSAFAVSCLCVIGIYGYFANSRPDSVSMEANFVRNYIVVGLNKSEDVNNRENVITFFAKAFNEAGICGSTVSDAQGFWRNRFNLKKPLQMPLNLNPSLVFFVDGPKEQTAKIANVVKKFLNPKNGYGQSCVLHTVEPLLISELIYEDKTERLY